MVRKKGIYGSRVAYVVIVMLALLLAGAPVLSTPVLAQGGEEQQRQTPRNLDWRYYGNDLGQMRYVDVDQINPDNVSQLQPVWIFHTNVFNDNTSFESQPIVVDGTMYVTSPHNHVFALDAATGELLWTYNPDMPPLEEMAICCGETNRGVAYGDGMVFVAQLDAHLVALDAETGEVVWDVVVDPWEAGWTETMAPQYVDGTVLVGGSGGEYMKRGHLVAYDAQSGEELWRFFTVPGPGEVGHDTWAGESWRTGGATVWTTPAVDPDLGLVIMSTGNAAPDLNGSNRAGENLFAASVVAVDVETGEYQWHFQTVHHDIWDYDGPSPPHLFTLEREGEQIPAVAHCNKNGWYYVLDRRDGTPLFNTPEVEVPTEPAWQNPWPTQPIPETAELIPHGIDEVPEGVEYRAAEMYEPPQEEPLIFQPGAESGCEWPAVAYSPRTGYSYIPAGGFEPWLVRATRTQFNTLGSILAQPVEGFEAYGLFDAFDTATGELAWQIRTDQRMVSSPVVAGDLVFFGESNGDFHAVDAENGEILWTWNPNQVADLYADQQAGQGQEQGRQGEGQDGGRGQGPGGEGEGQEAGQEQEEGRQAGGDVEGEEPSLPATFGGANGQATVYVVDGREYVVMAFGGNSQVRSGQFSPPGDALVAFALPRRGERGQAPDIIRAEPEQVELGEIPEERLVPKQNSAPEDAEVIRIKMRDLNYFPAEFTVEPGQQVALQLVNEGFYPYGTMVEMPDGPIALAEPIQPGNEAFMVFTAPEEPGDYQYAGSKSLAWLGMIGQMHVRAPEEEAPTEAEEEAPLIEVQDQAVTDQTVTIGRVVVDEPSWLVIRSRQRDGTPGRVLGFTQLDAGEHEDVTVELNRDVRAGRTLFAVLHDDTGRVGQFEFGEARGADAPVEEMGEFVAQPFTITSGQQ